MAAPNTNWEQIVTHTAWNYRPTLADNVSNHIPLLAQLKSLGFIQTLTGGRSIVEPVLYGRNLGVRSYSYYDILSTSPQEGVSAAEYLWKHVAGPVVISGQEEWENQGKSMLKKLLTSLMTQLDISMRESLDEMLNLDGSGNGGKDVTGLQLYVEEGTAWSTVGGIDSSVAANAFWRNQFIDFDAAHTSFPTEVGKSVEGMDVMRQMWNLCSRGSERPTLIYTTDELFAAYEAVGEGGHLQINAPSDRKVNKQMLDLGFDNLLFKTAPVIWGANCPTNTMYFLNSNFLKFYVGEGRNFKMTKFQDSKDQEARLAHMLLYCQLCVSNRARQGVIEDFIPS